MQPDPALADILEGRFPPGFFTGVCTVVLKLFACVFGTTGGGVAVFGKKDYQQLLVIRRMVQQFALPITIIGLETERAADGLALSSRNAYLSAEQRTQARALSQQLQWLAHQVREGAVPLAQLEAQAMAQLSAQGWQPDYLTVRQRHDLQCPADHARRRSLGCPGRGAPGGTRLIDHLEVFRRPRIPSCPFGQWMAKGSVFRWLGRCLAPSVVGAQKGHQMIELPWRCA